ncbi:mitochondrial K+-H+ exchange-related-domain-containing protein [Phyllosticta citrichinensis]
MRLFLLPISTRRALIYCERPGVATPGHQVSLLDKATNKANQTWANWEKPDNDAPWYRGGWKRSLTLHGNKVLRRIPYQEWGLKTIPALSGGRRQAELDGTDKVEVTFPGLFLKHDRVFPLLRQLATERQSLHRKRFWWSIVGMPISAPFALIPIIPNIPFFYLVFRAYSHWKALSGSKHLEFLLKHNLIKPTPSAELDEAYAAGLIHSTREDSRNSPPPTREHIEEVAKIVERQTNNGSEDVMVLQKWNGKLLAEKYHLPEMEVEIERAVEQVENSIKAKDELKEEKEEIEKSTSYGKDGVTSKHESKDTKG